MKLLLVDGNNLAIRSAFANSELSTRINADNAENQNPDDAFEEGELFPTGVFHGFFRSLSMLRSSYPEHYIAIAWDGGNTRRTTLTDPAVKEGIIPSGYKANRKTEEEPKREIANFLKQKDDLRKALSFTNIPQIVVKDEEADDVIASYVEKYSPISEQIIVYSTDKDFYQLLFHNVSILRSEEFVTEESFKSKYDIEPWQWVDVGGFMGDDGDNIFGVPGWGEKTAIATIQQSKTLEDSYVSFHKECDSLREKYPDLSEADFEILSKMKSPTGKEKYPGITKATPFTGVAWAIENKELKKPKSVLNALMHEKRARLAKVLKKMIVDLKLPILPGTCGTDSWNRKMEKEFLSFCSKFNLHSVSDDYEILCGIQPEAKKELAS